MKTKEEGRVLCTETRNQLDQLSSLLRIQTKRGIAAMDPKGYSMLCGVPNGNALHRLSNELYEANKAILMAKARLGYALGLFGNPYPYEKDTDRKTVADIKPASEVLEDPYSYDPEVEEGVAYSQLSYVEQLSYLRATAGSIYTRLENSVQAIEGHELILEGKTEELIQAIGHISSTMHYIIEARTMLGWELHALRQEAQAKKQEA